MKNRFETFTALIISIYKSVQKIKDIEMKEFGLKGNQVQCLYYLNNANKGLHFAELCQLCNEDKAAISRTLKDLQNKNLVVAYNLEDKKYKNTIQLTVEGKQISEKIASKINNFVDIGSAGISDSESRNLYLSLEKISSNLKNHYKNGEKND